MVGLILAIKAPNLLKFLPLRLPATIYIIYELLPLHWRVTVNTFSDSSAATSVVSSSVGAEIIITWSGAICVPYYTITVNSMTHTVNGSSFFYTPPSPGIYSFLINSFNYFGRDIWCIVVHPTLG